MALTVTQLADFVKLTLGGPADASLPTLALVNMSGRHLCGMTEWRWLDRAPTDIGTVAARTYLRLPADYGSMLSLADNTGSGPVVWTDLADINERRAASDQTSANGPWRGVVIEAPGSGSTLPAARVELFPIPSSTNASQFSLAYRAKWTDMTSDSDYLPTPEWCETLFIRVVQAHARGFMEEDKASLSERLTELAMSPELLAAIKQDRAKQRDRGGLQGSLSAPGGFDYRSRFTTITGP